jgi:hypothetical protein
MKQTLWLRIVVLAPPTGVTLAVQRGRSELLAPNAITADAATFEFSVTVADAATDPPSLTGEFTQGPPGARFVYVNSGTLAGQSASCWSRRAKVPLTSINSELLRSALQQSDAAHAAIAFVRLRIRRPILGSDSA